jgi:pimeloyl-ACP methyl ester carboxylesterase
MEVSSGGLKISYEDQGAGEPALLFLPGWCTSRRVFEPLVSRCAKKRRVLALDWRGHGRTEAPRADFTSADLVADALAVLAQSGVRQVVPVTLSHAGFVGLELRRQLGERVAGLILLDWIIGDPPPPFLGALDGLQDPGRWQATRDQLFSMWLAGVSQPEVIRYVHEDMGAFGAEMWARAGREIQAAYRRLGSPLKALAALTPPVRTLHLYAQPEDPGYLAAQETYAAQHPWFSVCRLPARTHFPMFEVADEMAAVIEVFSA